jgi:hypothetical protein
MVPTRTTSELDLDPTDEIDGFDAERVAQELERVPRRFAVAFAVRCALRVAPDLFEPDDPESVERLAALDSALGVVTRWTRGEPVSRFRLEQAQTDCGLVKEPAAEVAAKAASFATSITAETLPAVMAASVIGTYAASAAEAAWASEAVTSIQADLHRLGTKVAAEVDGPVPPDFFGPLWVGEEPEWSREGWARLKAYREEQAAPKPPPDEPGTTFEQLEAWFAELEKLRAERLPLPTEEERLADWNWYFAQLNAGAMGGYYGRYVAVLRGQVVGTDSDATRLELAMAHKYPDTHPDRFFITHVS